MPAPAPTSAPADEPVRRDAHEGEGATRGTNRMEAFADGVFAIAFTLSIFNLVLPELGREGANLGRDLLAEWPQTLGYAASCFVIGLYWIHHHFSGAIYRTTGHWFLIATTLFLTMIGYIAFPVRTFAASLAHPEAQRDAAVFLVTSLALVSCSWLLKWTIGNRHGHVDARLEQGYVARLTRRYRLVTAWNVAAAVLVWAEWRVGIVMALLGLVIKLRPPETPRYQTEAPPIEGES
ncbi:TMEM175 family protein [Sphingomonas humi]